MSVIRCGIGRAHERAFLLLRLSRQRPNGDCTRVQRRSLAYESDVGLELLLCPILVLLKFRQRIGLGL